MSTCPSQRLGKNVIFSDAVLNRRLFSFVKNLFTKTMSVCNENIKLSLVEINIFISAVKKETAEIMFVWKSVILFNPSVCLAVLFPLILYK